MPVPIDAPTSVPWRLDPCLVTIANILSRLSVSHVDNAIGRILGRPVRIPVVRGDHERQQLFALDRSIQSLTMRHGVRDPICVELSNIYHNLMRHWAEI